jgi:hypothetical protein
MYGLEPVPFNDGCKVDFMDRSIEYEVILLTSEEGEDAGQMGRFTARLKSCRDTYTRAKALDLLIKVFRGLESPLPRD